MKNVLLILLFFLIASCVYAQKNNDVSSVVGPLKMDSLNRFSNPLPSEIVVCWPLKKQEALTQMPIYTPPDIDTEMVYWSPEYEYNMPNPFYKKEQCGLRSNKPDKDK